MVWGIYVALHEKSGDAEALRRALFDSERALRALQSLAGAPWLLGEAPTLADCHLAPVIGYLAKEPQGRALLAQAPRMQAWWERCAARPGWAAVLGLGG